MCLRRSLVWWVWLGCGVVWLCGCPPSEESQGSVSVEAGDGGRTEADGGRRTSPFGGVSSSSTAGSDPPSSDGGSTAGSEATDQDRCDVDCDVAGDCGAGEACVQFAEARKCAPSSCLDCERGCVFDLRTCSFTRCVAEPPADAPDTCGQLCSSSADCGLGQACRDVFGVGECSPSECSPCSGFCDYDPVSCAYGGCYIATEAPATSTDPWYCGHQF